jgi:hypothetical protein
VTYEKAVEVILGLVERENTAADKVVKLKKELEDKTHRIQYALSRCSTCSPKPGSPTLCDACYMLQNGIAREDDYDGR